MHQLREKSVADGAEPASARRSSTRIFVVFSSTTIFSSGKAVMDGQEILISGRLGFLEPFDYRFGGTNVVKVTTDADPCPRIGVFTAVVRF